MTFVLPRDPTVQHSHIPWESEVPVQILATVRAIPISDTKVYLRVEVKYQYRYDAPGSRKNASTILWMRLERTFSLFPVARHLPEFLFTQAQYSRRPLWTFGTTGRWGNFGRDGHSEVWTILRRASLRNRFMYRYSPRTHLTS